MEIINRSTAKAEGLKRYYTGKPCINGHIDWRKTVNGSCNTCASIAIELFYAENKEKKTAQRRSYRERNLADILARGAIYRSENREALRIKQAKRYADDPEADWARSAAYRAENPERTASYYASWHAINNQLPHVKERNGVRLKTSRKENPERHRTYHRNRRARKRSADGNHTPSEIALLFTKQRGRCAYCKTSIKEKFHADHIIPLSKGGSNWISNIQLLCQSCNCRKHTKDAITFAQQMGFLL